MALPPSEEISLSAESRSDALEYEPLKISDLIIIGGGITGAGAALEAAKAGLKTFLIEGNDFAHGSSSRSSKMIHGGLRYLESLQINVVKESLQGRKELLNQASHIVKPISFLFPVYKGDPVGKFKLGVGLTLYDKLAGKDNLEKHKNLSPEDVKKSYPLLKDKGLKGAFLYQDAITDDSRLVVETLRAAARYENVSMANHCLAEEIDPKEHPGCITVYANDLIGGRRLRLKTKSVLLCGGPWTDRLLSKVTDLNYDKQLLPSKGAHILVKKNVLPVSTAVVLTEAEHHRIVFVVPRMGFTLVGTTETPFNGNPSNAYPDREDVDYLKGLVNNFFPEVNLKDSDILSAYAGVRPLVKSQDSKEGEEGVVSRDHVIKEVHPKIFYVAGGKYTTYRSMSREAIEEVAKSIDQKIAEKSQDEATTPLAPWNTPEMLKKLDSDFVNLTIRSGVSSKTLKKWSWFYGSEVRTLVNLIHENPKLQESLDPNDESCIWKLVHVKFAVEMEMALTIEDVLVRRLNTFFLSSSDQGLHAAKLCAPLMESLLGWEPEYTERQLVLFHERRDLETRWRDR